MPNPGLALDRLSCSRFLSNQFRLLLTAAAYILVQALRLHAAGTVWVRASAHRDQPDRSIVITRIGRS